MNDSATNIKDTNSYSHECLLSIIVPVYNVEKYIHTCIESLYRQNLDEKVFEVIIVNDGTKDHSMEVIQDIISQHANITVINQENLSLSVARNNGIAAAKGEYILMPDSDDMLIDNSLPQLLEKAIESQVDIIVADFLVSSNSKKIENLINIKQERFEFKEKTGEELFLEDLNPNQCYVWRALYRNKFIRKNQLSFVPDVYYQDVPFTHEAYLKANKCIKTTWKLNVYRRGRQGAATSSFNKKKALDFCTVIAKTWELRLLPNLTPKVLRKLNDDIYASFIATIYASLHIFKDTSTLIEILDNLKQKAPDLKFSHGIKQKTETFLFRSMPYFYIILRKLHWKCIKH